MEGDFQRHIKAMNARYQQDLRDDYHRELLGINDSRINRFVTGETSQFRTSEKEEEKRKILTALQTLLIDLEYRATYDHFSGFLDDEETAVCDALIQNTEQLDAVRSKLNESLGNAVTMPDGTRIFRDKETSEVETEHGRKLEPIEYEHIVWPDDVPSLEDYKANKAELARLQKERVELIHYQTQILDPARARLEDEDHPLSIDEMDSLEQSIIDKKPEVLRQAPKQIDPEVQIGMAVSNSSNPNTSIPKV